MVPPSRRRLQKVELGSEQCEQHYPELSRGVRYYICGGLGEGKGDCDPRDGIHEWMPRLSGNAGVPAKTTWWNCLSFF